MGVTFPKHYAIFFVLYNITYLAIGLVMFIYGIVTAVEITSFNSFNDSDFIAGSVIFVIVGFMKVLASILGFAALYFEKKTLFAVYVLMSIVLMLLTYTAAIYSFLARPGAYNTLRTRLVNVYDDNNTADIMDLQNDLNCCGPTRVFDNSTVACTSTRPMQSRAGAGCLQHLSDAVLDSLYNVGAIGMAFGTFELTSFLVALQHTEGSGL